MTTTIHGATTTSKLEDLITHYLDGIAFKSTDDEGDDERVLLIDDNRIAQLKTSKKALASIKKDLLDYRTEEIKAYKNLEFTIISSI